MRNLTLYVAASPIGLATLVLAGGCTVEATPISTPPPKVTVAHPEVRELVNYDEYNGRTEAAATVEVRARVRGHIDKVQFVDGQIVNAGDLLFELDPRPFQSEVDRATEQVKIFEAQLVVAANEERRQKELFAKTVATERDVEEAEGKRKSLEAQISAAQEEVRRRELELSYSKMTAPIGGKISRALLTEGNLVNAGGSDPVLTTIVALDPIRVNFSVDERALLEYRRRRQTSSTEKLKPLEEAEIPFEFGLEIDEGFPHKGVLDFAENRIDAATGTIQIRGKTDNADGQFVPGGRVRVRVAVSDPYKAVLVPDTAVLSDQDKKYLLCLNENKEVKRRDIKLGKLLEDGMRVTLPVDEKDEGLKPDEWVIVLGQQRARIGYAVDPVDTESNAIAAK
ncbi:MAG: efflux RND transporter periplasmic adaptor subunit [Planctomycetota bacterium]|nr:efflux RND transporter periplasmic adaptor subunit [Planctomycetota bacterium]MDA1213161.1 efflux RND transporter periplasmic adaptor subunit [Planctomycetota bacterium]